jgi:transcriptional regulator with XRE-family HTH domain
LRQARTARRISQLELSLRIGVSQRHVSFVESGRAKPSRHLLLAWLQELQAPLALANAALLQAGYAPAYSDSAPGDAALKPALAALAQLLAAHDPQPAFVMDMEWNLVNTNKGGQWLAHTLMPWLADLAPGTPLNMLDALIHPGGMTRAMTNLAEVGPALLAHLRDDACLLPALSPRVEAFAALLRQRLGVRATQAAGFAAASPRQTSPVLTSRFATAHGSLAFFSMFTTFGTPQDITLASLRVEHLFAADDATKAVLAQKV